MKRKKKSNGRRAIPEKILDNSPRELVLRSVREWMEKGRLPPGAKVPSQRTLADMFNVSQRTVGYALQMLEDEGLIVRVSVSRRLVRKGSAPSLVSNSIILLSTFTTDMSQWMGSSGKMEAVEVAAMKSVQEAGLNLLRIDPERLGRDGNADILNGRPKGILVMHHVGESWTDPKFYQSFRSFGIPVVVNGDAPHLRNCDRVLADHEGGTAHLVQWLISMGKTRILRLWSGTPTDYWMAARNAGYEKAVANAGLKSLPPIAIPQNLLTRIIDKVDFGARARVAASLLAPHMQSARPPDALMVTTDPEVYVISAACRLLGKQPNKDILLVGFDNIATPPELNGYETAGPAATVDKLNQDIGVGMVKLLMDRADGHLPKEPQRIVMPAKLVIHHEQETAGVAAQNVQV